MVLVRIIASQFCKTNFLIGRTQVLLFVICIAVEAESPRYVVGAILVDTE